MDQFLKIAEKMFVDRMISKHSPVTHKSKVGLFAFALSGLLFLTGLGMLLYASYIWFNLTYTPILASMMLGAMLISTAIIICVLMCLITSYQRRKVIKMRTDITDDITAVIGMFENEIDVTQPLKDNPKTTIAIAALAGFIVADKYL
jgi:hypothetical protein